MRDILREYLREILKKVIIFTKESIICMGVVVAKKICMKRIENASLKDKVMPFKIPS
ncbi:MAG: hypothetical protein PWQ77_184 [Kosmotogales bacterium]|nr:hypothetical protein [Kosmotogales bacterium]